MKKTICIFTVFLPVLNATGTLSAQSTGSQAVAFPPALKVGLVCAGVGSDNTFWHLALGANGKPVILVSDPPVTSGWPRGPYASMKVQDVVPGMTAFSLIFLAPVSGQAYKLALIVDTKNPKRLVGTSTSIDTNQHIDVNFTC